MPSGAKKRKAARKKKEKENNNINPPSINNPPHGNDELKSQDEKGSDGGEGDSPSYDEHGDRHDPFNGGSEEVEDRDPTPAWRIASDVKSVEKVPGDVKVDHVLGGKEDNDVMIKRGLESEERCERKDESFELVETAKESCYESGNGGGGGASNGESLTRNNTKDENYDSLGEAIACHEMVKSVDSSPSEITLSRKGEPVESEETGGTSAAEYSINSVKDVASVSEVENNDIGGVLLEKSVVPPLEAVNLTVKTTEDNVDPLTDKNATTSTLEESKPKEYESKVLNSPSTRPSTKFTNGAEHGKDSETPECSENQNATTSTLEESKPKEFESKVLNSPSTRPSTKFTNGAEHGKDSETPECSENQPRVSSAPNMVRRTSWWSCCGLFEVLSGSDR